MCAAYLARIFSVIIAGGNMQKIVTLLSLVILATLLFTACGTRNVSADLNQSVELRPGQSVSIKGEELTITFLEISQDSRCPTGAT